MFRTNSRLWIKPVLVALLVLSSALGLARTARADDAFEWFYGTWRVSYPDEAYGDYVNGSAIVSRSSKEGGPPVVTLHLQDTLSKKNFRIDVRDVTQNETQVVLKFYGLSPSAAKTYNGKADPARIFNRDEETPPQGVDGVLVKSISADSLVNVSSTAASLPASGSIPVSDDDRFPVSEEITLTLSKIAPGTLGGGTWRYADSPAGMYARRAGRRIVSQGYVEGSESWSKLERNAIRQVTELKDKRLTVSGEDVDVPHIRVHLKIEGDGLPVYHGDAREIVFDSPHIRYDETDPDLRDGFVKGVRGETITPSGGSRRLDVLEIRVKLGPGIAAGPKTFRVNGMDAVWVLQFEEKMEDLAFKRKTGDGDAAIFETTKMLVQGDIFVLEAAITSELMFGKRLLSLRNGKREIYRTVLNQSDADFRIYTSAPMKVSEGETITLEDGKLPDVPTVQASPGEVLTVYTADTKEPVEWGSIDVFDGDAVKKPKLIVHPPNQWMSDYSIGSVVVDEPFGVYLRLPKKDSRETAEITFTNLRSGESEEIEVHYKGGDEKALVVYLVPESNLTIAGGLEDSFANWMGTHISLVDTRDGDEIEVSYGDVKTKLSVYDTRLKQRLAVRRQQLDATKEGLLSYQRDSKLSPEFRAQVTLQLELIAHAFQLIGHDSLFDIHRVMVLEAYLGLIQEGFEHFRTLASWPVHPTYGVPMSSSREQEVVGYAINVRAKNNLRNTAMGLFKDLSIGLNRFVMEQSGVNGIYTAVWGRDVFGRRINMMERVLGALEAFGAIESGVLGTWRRKTFAFVEARSAPGAMPGRKRKGSTGFSTPEKARVQRVADILKDLEVPNPDRSARRLLESGGDMPSDIAAIAAAYDEGMPASKIMSRLNMSRQELAELLDIYHKDYLGVDNLAARRNMLRKYLGSDAPMPFDLLGGESKSGSTLITKRPGTGDDFGMPSWKGSNEPYRPLVYDAELPHQGRRPMNEYIGDILDGLEKEDRMFGDVSEEYMAQRRARAFAALERQHEVVDLIEDITGARQRSDYGGIGVWQAKGCDPRECAIGQVFMNHAEVSPRRAMSVLQMSEDEYRGVLENFLRDTQKVENPALRQQLIDEYIAG